MTEKKVKNEQWTIKELISKINDKEIKKPRFQRKKKWDIRPKKNNYPNNYDYINFLFHTENSVHAITFGQESNLNGLIYSNIDGNNRINAIKHFIDNPFEVFTEYLDKLFNIFDNINSKNNDKIKKIFKSLSYEEIIKIKTPAKFFRDRNEKELWIEIRDKEEEIEKEIEEIQQKLMINKSDRFDRNVKINVNLFEGYNTDELNTTFEDINKYNSKLTETELLGSRLHNVSNFIITDKSFESELIVCIKQYYIDKSNNEVLDCYKFQGESINANDFIVGFQNLYNTKYNFISKTEVDGLSLFFKLWKILYDSFENTFTTENINNFIEKINYSCKILQETISIIFTDKINDKIFNKTCQEKIGTLKKNNILMLICCIIGFKNKDIIKKKIIKNLEKCLIYHFFISDIKDTDKKDIFRTNDLLTYKAGGTFINNICEKLLYDPQIISNKLNKEVYNNLLDYLLEEINIPYIRRLDNGKNKKDKRRNLRFIDKTLMFYYFKEKMPTNMLDKKYSIEHIAPNSSDWEGELNKDRTGNLIPLIDEINTLRGNKHINKYNTTNDGIVFRNFMKDIIPDDTTYDNFIHHKKKPFIYNNGKYNDMCKKNEEIYKNNLIKCLF